MPASSDLINGLFEMLGGGFVLLSVIKLHREKIAKGVSWLHVGFFTSWGFWNLFFYPALGQWMSFWGGLGLVAINTFWLGQIVWYNHIRAGWRCDETALAGANHTSIFREDMLANASVMGVHEYGGPVLRPDRVMVPDQFGGFDRHSLDIRGTE